MGNSLALDTQSFHPAFKQWIVWWMAISHNNGSSQWCQAHQEQVVPFFLLRKSETNPWPLTSVPRQNISHASNTNTCFHLNEYKYMIKQPAKNPPPEGGFLWQAKHSHFGCWKPHPDVLCIAYLTRLTPVPWSAHHACTRVFRFGI